MQLNPLFKTKIQDGESAVRALATPERLTVLAVDDEPEITASIAELVGERYTVLTARSGHEAIEIMERQPVAVLLTDQRMPGLTGAELLAHSLKLAPDASRILFTGYSDIEAVIEAINSGKVYYYLAKPWQPGELQAVLSRGLERYRLVIENRRLVDELRSANVELERRVRERTAKLRRQNESLRQARNRIKELSRLDPLTGIANRRQIDEVFAQEVERSRRYGAGFSLIMADIDRFKAVNDTHGHMVGDQVLRQVADVLRDAIRAVDVVGRHGGEEFIIVLPNTDLGESRLLAERLRVRIESMPVDFRPEPVTMSFGVASLREGDTKTSLMQRADRALYEAKNRGRNRVECGESESET